MICVVEYYPKIPKVFGLVRNKKVHPHVYYDADEIPPGVPYPRVTHCCMIVGLEKEDFK